MDARATPYLLIWSSYWAPFLDGIIDCCVVVRELCAQTHTVLSKTLKLHNFKRNGPNPIKPYMGGKLSLSPIDWLCLNRCAL